jgi:hypothetical protein
MLPDLDGTGYGLMPAGRHAATLDEIEERFVTAAPYGEARARIWAGFRVWESLLREQLPTAILWIDGGFVTHKDWAAPSDLDVLVLARQGEAAKADRVKLEPLLTVDDGVNRVQPMSGLVDAHFALRGDGPLIVFFDGWWQKVRGRDRLEVPGLTKGYVEVKP